MMRKKRKRPPVTFQEWFVVLNACVPLVIMLLDAKNHRLGSDPIRTTLHTTGSIAIGLLVLSLTITPIRKWTTWKTVILYRRPLGLMAFLYAMAHIAIYVVHDQERNFAAIGQELLQRRYLQAGLASACLLLPLAITSTPAMMKRLGLARWKKLHRLVYPAAIFAVVHYLAQSKADIRWQIAYVVVLGVLLGWRIKQAMNNRQGNKTETTAT
jgi:sulfoxide reductase heme-binding subunit YedZ